MQVNVTFECVSAPGVHCFVFLSEKRRRGTTKSFNSHEIHFISCINQEGKILAFRAVHVKDEDQDEKLCRYTLIYLVSNLNIFSITRILIIFLNVQTMTIKF